MSAFGTSKRFLAVIIPTFHIRVLNGIPTLGNVLRLTQMALGMEKEYLEKRTPSSQMLNNRKTAFS